MLKANQGGLKDHWQGPLGAGKGPLTGLVRILVEGRGQDREWVADLWAVARRPSRKSSVMEFRIYDPAEAGALGIRVKDYSAFDHRPGLVLFEGWLNPASGETRLFDLRALAAKAV